MDNVAATCADDESDFRDVRHTFIMKVFGWLEKRQGSLSSGFFFIMLIYLKDLTGISLRCRCLLDVITVKPSVIFKKTCLFISMVGS